MLKQITAKKIEPYLFMDGRADEAIEFYKRALGAEEQMIMRYSDCPDKSSPIPPGGENKIMHAGLKVGETILMLSDGYCTGQAKFEGVSLCIEAGSEADADNIFAALQEDGGQVQMPLSKTFFSPKFGMVADKFGISWMVIVAE